MAIVIVDYGRGNLRSVAKAFEHVGAEVVLTDDPRTVELADKLVVPGVGAFGDCMGRLRELRLADAIVAHVARKKPFLGICLGLQVLFESSEESPGVSGLGIFPGKVVKFVAKGPEQKIPHMGWNHVVPTRPVHPLLSAGAQPTAFYFVHSYYVVPQDPNLVAATAQYGEPFCAAIGNESVFACQFHPEKSQTAGLEILKRFTTW